MNKTERVEIFCQDEWADKPEYLDITITDQLVARVQTLRQAAIHADADSVTTRWYDGLILGDESEEGDNPNLINQDAYSHIISHTLVVDAWGLRFEFYGKWGGERYWSDALPFDVLWDDTEPGEAKNNGDAINWSFILTTLKCAQADIESLIQVAGTDPHNEDDMLAENYAAQWQTLQELATAIGQLETHLSTQAA